MGQVLQQRLMNHAQAAAYLGVSKGQLKRLVALEQIPQPKKFAVGKSARKYYEKAWLDAFSDNALNTADKDASAKAKAQAILAKL
jgi:hypothetical protein